jgi:hypothetical protein
MAGTRQRRSVIYRREFTQLRGLVHRSKELFAEHGKFNGADLYWRDLPGDRVIEFGAVQYEDDSRKYQGRPHDFIGFDELPHFLESQFWFLLGWLRSTIPGQRCRVGVTFNPPTRASERWVLRMFAPWLDRKHPNPAIPGELRWYARIAGEDVERPDGSPFEHDGETIVPLSRTFYPARLADNPALAETGYGAQLQSLPEPLRSQLLYGDFDAAVTDDPWQIIPTAWIEAAMARWRAIGGAKYHPNTSPHVIGHDVAHGGADKTVNACRHGDWFAPLDRHAGKDTPDGITAARTVLPLWRANTQVHVDALGWGASSFERLKEQPPHGFGLPAHAIDFGARSEYTDKSGLYRCVNVRAEAYWRMRDELDPERPGGATLMLPDDPELLADLTSARYEVTTSGIKVEAKDEIKRRIGRSPDAGDAVCLALIPTPTRTKADNTIRRGYATRPGYRG